MSLSDVKGIAFPFRFGANGHIVRVNGIDKIKDNLKGLVLTRLGERVMEPAIGTIGYQRLFRNHTDAQKRIVERLVRDAISRFENRVLVRSVDISERQYQSGSAIIIEVQFKVRDTQESDSFTIRIGGDA